MKKDDLIKIMIRTTKENDGKPLGMIRLEKEQGITKNIWLKYWPTYSSYVKESGIKPNVFSKQGYDEDFLIQKMIDLIKDTGDFPTNNAVRHKSKNDKDFPNFTTFHKLGSKHERARKIIEYCEKKGGLNEIIRICLPYCKADMRDDEIESEEEIHTSSYVYLMKSGKFYKIGRSDSPGRREYDLNLTLPEETKCIHKIRTDDPIGIEKYWHERFADKRKGGEWFDLSNNDVKNFKRKKIM